jgi:hypothetical protein
MIVVVATVSIMPVIVFLEALLAYDDACRILHGVEE